MNIDNIEPIIQDKSEINIFNTIGELAKYNGFKVKYFKTQFLTIDKKSIDTLNSNIADLFNKIRINPSVYIHYVHIIKNKKIISIYYDNLAVLANMNYPYYELCSDDIYRYNIDEELKLYNDIKKIIERK